MKNEKNKIKIGFCPRCNAMFDVEVNEDNDIILITINCRHDSEIQEEAEKIKGEEQC